MAAHGLTSGINIMDKTKLALIALMLGGLTTLSGCVAAALGAGYVIGEEVSENDGDFDPLDEVVDGEK